MLGPVVAVTTGFCCCFGLVSTLAQLVYSVWHSVRSNLLATLSHVRVMRDHGIAVGLDAAYRRYIAFKRLRHAFIMYVLGCTCAWPHMSWMEC